MGLTQGLRCWGKGGGGGEPQGIPGTVYSSVSRDVHKVLGIVKAGLHITQDWDHLRAMPSSV